MTLIQPMANERRPLFNRIVNPGVPPWFAIPCNLAAGIALVLLAIHPVRNFNLAMAFLLPAATVLYGVALARWWLLRKDRDDVRDGNTFD